VDLQERHHGQDVPQVRLGGALEPAPVLVLEDAEGASGGKDGREVEAERLPFGQVLVRRAEERGGLARVAPLCGGRDPHERERDGLERRLEEALAERASCGTEEPAVEVADADLEVLVRVLGERGRGQKEEEYPPGHGIHATPVDGRVPAGGVIDGDARPSDRGHGGPAAQQRAERVCCSGPGIRGARVSGRGSRGRWWGQVWGR